MQNNLLLYVLSHFFFSRFLFLLICIWDNVLFGRRYFACSFLLWMHIFKIYKKIFLSYNIVLLFYFIILFVGVVRYSFFVPSSFSREWVFFCELYWRCDVDISAITNQRFWLYECSYFHSLCRKWTKICKYTSWQQWKAEWIDTKYFGMYFICLRSHPHSHMHGHMKRMRCCYKRSTTICENNTKHFAQSIIHPFDTNYRVGHSTQKNIKCARQLNILYMWSPLCLVH